jgi:hypothetical protein
MEAELLDKLSRLYVLEKEREAKGFKRLQIFSGQSQKSQRVIVIKPS